MANSLTFNDTDLGTYGLVVVNRTTPSFKQRVDYTQLLDIAYPFGATREAKFISLEIAVVGSSHADVESKLDSIKLILNQRDTKHLILDAQDDRYFNAQFVSLSGRFQSPVAFVGGLDFICPDPLAYGSGDEISPTHHLDVENPAIETTGGTGYIKPIYTLTAEEGLGTEEAPITIKVECIETVEELQWTGSLANGEELEIDVANWTVKKEGDASMAAVTGLFPRLLPATDNRIKVTGFGAAGTLNIKYRNTYV